MWQSRHDIEMLRRKTKVFVKVLRSCGQRHSEDLDFDLDCVVRGDFGTLLILV